MTLEELNTMDPGDAAIALTKCCGSSKWISEMVASRPFSDVDDLLKMAEKVWFYCFELDWLEAFSHHPKIGDTESLNKKFSSTKDWAGDEQKGVDIANDDTIEQLAELNEKYEQKFGFIFIVCATGKTAGQMLELLEERIKNDYQEELQIAMGEQHKITILRLKKLLS
jgi:2-oxo-4-hydroxy-4-carboxy-5-ureidoimidazoline decarboxylase